MIISWTALVLFSLAQAPSLISQVRITHSPKTFSSPQGEYSGFVEYGQGNSEYVPFRSFALRDKTGKEIWKKDDFNHTLVDIADNGTVVGIDFDGPISGRAKLHFYDITGKRRGHASVGFLDKRAFSEKGNLYCVLDGEEGLRVFNPEGGELYNLGRGNWFSISRDGRMIALADESAIIFFQDGKRIGRIPLSSPFVRQMKFSADGSLFGYITRKDIYIYRVKEMALVFHHQESNPQRNFTSFDISPSSDLVIAGLEEDKGRGSPERRSRGIISLFDLKGNYLWQEEIRYSRWNAFIPEVRFLVDRSFRIKTVEEIYEYRY